MEPSPVYRKLILLIALTVPLAAQGNSRLSGVIRARLSRGPEALLGVPVYLTRLPEGGGERIAVNRVVLTDQSGAYTFADLPYGRYRICPHVPRTTYLSPCDWDAKVDLITVGTNVSNFQVTQDYTLDTGAILTVAVDDEDGELRKSGRQGAGLEVTVQGPHGPVRAMEGAQIGARQNLTVTVPKSRTAQILIKTAIPTVVDTDDQGTRRQLNPTTGHALALGQEDSREVRFFVRKAGGL